MAYPHYNQWAPVSPAPQQYEMTEYIPPSASWSGNLHSGLLPGVSGTGESSEWLIGKGKDAGQAEPHWKAKSFKQKWLGGLKLVLRVYTSLTALVLVINVAWLAWAASHYELENGYGALQEGSCESSESLNRWIHLVINVLSTGLLLGSSAFMAAALAPSRQEIKKAHQQGKWLSVGLLSSRNVFGVSSKKTMACAILALTSVPVHLFYNSVIFLSLSTNEYFWAVTTEDFVSGAPFNLSNSNYNAPMLNPIENSDVFVGTPGSFTSAVDWQYQYEQIQLNVSTYDRLSNEECISTYSQRLISDRRSVVAVSSATNDTNSVFVFDASEIDSGGDTDPSNWICSQSTELVGAEDLTCDATPYLEQPEDWKLFGYPIVYCLSERVPGSCAVKYSIELAIIVIVCNAVKLLVEIYILYSGWLDNAITCVGDAIASFLLEKDNQTRNMSLVSISFVDQALQTPEPGRLPLPYTGSRLRWSAVISRKRWLLSLLIMILSVILVGILFGMGLSLVGSKGHSTSIGNLWKLGFGNTDPEFLVASDNFGTPITLSLLANTPQLILAIIYYVYNGMLGAFFSAHEYAGFAVKAQYLRVSTPAGKQQGTWLLGIPLLWGVPFLALQVFLHWCVSQGFFVVYLRTVNEDGSPNRGSGNVSNCGFSPIAILFAMIIALVLMFSTIALGARRFPPGSPPVAGNCSAVISAACHPRRTDEAMLYHPLRWGCTETDSLGVGHCSFTAAGGYYSASGGVENLQLGNYYR